MIEQLLGWAANLGLVIGAILLFRKNIFGFISNAVGCCFYVTQGMLMSNWSLVALNTFLVGMNLFTILRWRKGKP